MKYKYLIKLFNDLKKFFLIGLIGVFQNVYSHENTFNLKGVIHDENHSPLTGASVLLNNGEYATVSDNAGQFTFYNIVEKDYELKISFVGYETQKFKIFSKNIKNEIIICLKPESQMLNAIEVTAHQSEIQKRKQSISIELIQEEFIKEKKAGSLMQTLSSIPGVNSMDIGSGLSKPMIRGMSYYRVALAHNGIKQEGQQWSTHDGIAIDQQSVNHVEIIKGPASLRYGSDAIGGVINILPSHIPLRQGVSGSVSMITKTNNNWYGSSGNVSVRHGDFYFHTTLTYNSYGDFKVPQTDSFLLPAPVSAVEASHTVKMGSRVINTAGREKAITLSTGIIKKWGNSYFDLSYYQSKSGFFDWERSKYDSVRINHEKNFNDIKMPYHQMQHITINHFTNVFIHKNKLELALGYQNNHSQEHSYLSDRTGNRYNDVLKYQNLNNLDLLLKLSTITGNLSYTLNTLNRQTLCIGINNQIQHHQTDGYGHILPNYTRFIIGSFVIHRFNISEQWVLNNGFRVDYGKLQIQQSINPDPEYGDTIFNNDIQRNFPGFAFSSGINYLPNRDLTIKFNIGKGYRIPSVYELAAYGLHRHEGRFENGDAQLSPEQAYQFDAGIENKWQKISLSLSPFFNYFTNYLYINPTSALRSEGQVYEYRQSTAMLTGGEASINYKMTRQVYVNIGAEYVYAVNLDLMKALPFTPPFSTICDIKYSLHDAHYFKQNTIGVEAIFVAAQEYTVPNELSTPGYSIYGLSTSTKITIASIEINLMLKIHNVFDSKYYNHISFYRRLRVPEPGRNIQIFISIPFDSNSKNNK